jgi:NAD dependent epimerase/dehydratase family enzyme
MSWVTLEDVIGILRYALENAGVSGAINVVAPHPVRNAEFTGALARAMHRPAVFAAPSFALRLALSQEMADSMLLTSQRVAPARLAGFAYPFRHPDVQSALIQVLSP